MEKEKWIDGILTTAEEVSPAEARVELWTGIKNRISKPTVVSATVVWIAAASLALLIALNVTALAESATNSTTIVTDSNSLTDSNFNLY